MPSPPGPSPAHPLLRLLELEPKGRDRYVAATPSDGPSRLFGGQVASQSLRAATLTVEPERHANSMHAYFVRPGTPEVPLELEVHRVRDGRSFSIRQVTASQGGDEIFVLGASFHVAEEGDDWQLPAPAGVPGPDDTADFESPLGRFSSMSPFDLRPVRTGAAFPVMHPFWVRTKERLDDDPALHACVVAFISDMGVVGSARGPSSTAVPFAGASLDHAVWFHRPVRADEWLLFSVAPVTNAAARGLALGTMHTGDGVHAASVVQEALLRPTRTTPLP